MDAHTLDLTLPSEAGSVAEARTRVCDAIAPEFGDNEVETLRLLVSEVVTNAVRHGDGTEPVELHATWNSEVRVEVSDHGDGFTPDAADRRARRAGRVRALPRRPARRPLGRRDRRRHDRLVRLAAPLTSRVR